MLEPPRLVPGSAYHGNVGGRRPTVLLPRSVIFIRFTAPLLWQPPPPGCPARKRPPSRLGRPLLPLRRAPRRTGALTLPTRRSYALQAILWIPLRPWSASGPPLPPPPTPPQCRDRPSSFSPPFLHRRRRCWCLGSSYIPAAARLLPNLFLAHPICICHADRPCPGRNVIVILLAIIIPVPILFLLWWGFCDMRKFVPDRTCWSLLLTVLEIILRNKPTYDKLRVLIINKDVRKSLTRKNGNENPIWS